MFSITAYDAPACASHYCSFGTNFKYIEGQNSVAAKIPMTTPVMSRNSTAGWEISFYVPASIFGNNASAIPTSSSVSIAAIPQQGATFAVFEFPGYATEEQFATYDAQVRERGSGLTRSRRRQIMMALSEARCRRLSC